MLTAIRRMASRIGFGVVAGAAGTAAMTGLQMIEMKAKDREPSTMPADAVEKLLDVEPEDERAEMQLASLTHWGYGTALGVLRGLLGSAGLRPWPADVAFFAAVWGGALTMLPSLGLAPPPTRWGPKQLASDAAHHLVYAASVAAVYRLLARRPRSLVTRVGETLRSAA